MAAPGLMARSTPVVMGTDLWSCRQGSRRPRRRSEAPMLPLPSTRQQSPLPAAPPSAALGEGNEDRRKSPPRHQLPFDPR